MKNIFACLFCAALFVSACDSFAGTEVSKPEESSLSSDASSVCEEIQEMYRKGTLKNLAAEKYPANEPFYVDIDNDGHDEELKYFNSRTYAYIAEIIDGEVIGLPWLNTTQGFGNYTGNGIITYGEKFLQIHFGDGILEIQQLTEKTAEEKASRPKLSHRIYNVKTLCKFYDD